ncbi:MAG: MerC domain-containing protein [Pirellulaceae bacterium]|nr:MerC domain-containing protein [Pirellulaceae bacterium]
MSAWSDFLGITASVGCAIHCAAMPLVIPFLPMLGLTIFADEMFHKVMVVVCSLLAIGAFWPGWKQHRCFLPMSLAGIGLTLIATTAFALEHQCCAGESCYEKLASAPTCDKACCEEKGGTAKDTGNEAKKEPCCEEPASAPTCDKACCEEKDGTAKDTGNEAKEEPCCEKPASAPTCDKACCEEKDGTTKDTGNEAKDVSKNVENSESLPTVDANDSSLFSLFIPFITPLGGLILIGAHLVNRRYTCSCQACKV